MLASFTFYGGYIGYSLNHVDQKYKSINKSAMTMCNIIRILEGLGPEKCKQQMIFETACKLHS